MICQQVITRFKIAVLVLLGGQLSFSEIVKSIGYNEQSLTRLLRHAMTMRIFCESTTGMVAHTNIWKLLRKPHVHDWMSVACEDMWPAAIKVCSMASSKLNDRLGFVQEDFMLSYKF
jgi:hypothetical protein